MYSTDPHGSLFFLYLKIAHSKVLFPLLQEPGCQIIQGIAASVTDSSLTTTTGQVIPFDICVLATGQETPTYMPDPVTEGSMSTRKANIEALHNKIKAAKTIVISGGGPLGCETAADIQLRFPDKQVILVHPRDNILHTMHWGLPEFGTKTLQTMGVKLILNDKVTDYNDSTNTVTLASGKTIESCDLYIPAHATGGGNCKFLPPESQIKGYAKVNKKTFLVNGFEKVFAIGDCSTIDNIKLMMKVGEQASHMCKNVCKMLNGEPLAEYSPGFKGSVQGPGIVSLGHDHPDAVALGPDLGEGFMGYLVFVFLGWCGPPGGKKMAQFKSKFNASVTPKLGKGMSE